MDTFAPKSQRTRIALLVVVVVAALIALGLGVWLASLGLGRGVPTATGDEPGGVFGGFLVPQGQLLSFKGVPEVDWSLAGIIQKTDAENKYFEIKTSPVFPVLLDSFGFSDGFKVYFDDTVVVAHTFVETDNGALAKIGQWRTTSVSSLVPGKPVRAFGVVRDGVFFAIAVTVFDFAP